MRSALGDRRVTPDFPVNRSAEAGDDGELSDQGRDASSGWAVFLAYKNAEGVLSQRRVTCRKISGMGSIRYFHGYCHERRRARTFRLDRIEELVDYRTGECVDPVRHFEDLRMHGLIEMEDRCVPDLAAVLTFMARCDGEFHPLEVSAIEDGLSQYLLRCGGSDRELGKVLKNLPAIAPDAEDVVTATERLLASAACPSIARIILESSSNVMGADGEYRSEEAAWSSKLHGVLQAAAA